MSFGITAKDAPAVPSLPTYAQCVEVSGASRLVFVSGQVPVRADGSVPDSFEDQARVVWDNVRQQLAAAKMTFDNLVKVTIFLSDRKYTADYRRTRDEALGGRRVGLTTIITGIFDEGWLLEIEAIAAA
jgi:2-iminobutanoate/2-iminopropanoate deaminase